MPAAQRLHVAAPEAATKPAAHAAQTVLLVVVHVRLTTLPAPHAAQGVQELAPGAA